MGYSRGVGGLVLMRSAGKMYPPLRLIERNRHTECYMEILL